MDEVEAAKARIMDHMHGRKVSPAVTRLEAVADVYGIALREQVTAYMNTATKAFEEYAQRNGRSPGIAARVKDRFRKDFLN